MEYNLYTDGSALGHSPNYIGGWGLVVVNQGNEEMVSLSGAKFPSTNNEMELTALLRALEWSIERQVLEPTSIFNIYTDSAYSLNSITKWMYGWAQNGWLNSKGDPVKNQELIESFYSLMSFPLEGVNFIKVKGHSGHEYNDIADVLATTASKARKEELKKEGVI